MKVLAVLASLLAASTSACATGPDAALPTGVAPFVDAARQSLVSAWDGLGSPGFRFLAARCADDGGLVLLFEQTGMFGIDGVAVAMSGRPQAIDGGWAGGFAPIDPATDPEIAFFFAERREVPCEAG